MKTRMIDAFGRMKIDGASPVRARLIQASPLAIAAFPEADPKVPILFTLTEPPRVQGRIMTAQLIGGGELQFQRASCGCQTPNVLKGAASQFLARVPAAADA